MRGCDVVEINKAYAQALKDKNLFPQIVVGGNGENGRTALCVDLVELLRAKTARDLAIDLKEKKETPHQQ